MSDLQLFSRSFWGAKYRNGVADRAVGDLKLRTYINWTFRTIRADASQDEEKSYMYDLEEFWQARDIYGQPYAFVVMPSGRIYEGVSINRVGRHARDVRNVSHAGLLIVTEHGESVTDEACTALEELLVYGERQGWWKDPFVEWFDEPVDENQNESEEDHEEANS